MTASPNRRGTTLVELLVVLTILAIVGAVTAPAWRAPRDAPIASEAEVLRRLRALAHRTGRAVSDTATYAAGLAIVTVWPNGLVLVDSATLARSGPPRRADVH